MTMKEVDEEAEQVKSTPGKKVELKDVEKRLIQKEREQGLFPESNRKIPDTTKRTYQGLIAAKAGISLVKGGNPKTEARETAEKSLIASQSLGVTAGIANFKLVDHPNPKYEAKLNQLTSEDRWFIDQVRAMHPDKHVESRPPCCIVNQDDHTHFFCRGKQPDKSKEWGLVATSALEEKHTHSINYVENSNKMNGMRSKSHLITNAAGDSAPPCICIKLTREEMPKHDFVISGFKGLCPGGGTGDRKHEDWLGILDGGRWRQG